MPGHRRRLFFCALAALLSACYLGLLSFSRYRYTCAVCRANRVDPTCFGLRWSSLEETDCSRWYSENVERSHDHSWVKYTHCRSWGIPGLYGGYSCSVGGPITGLSRRVQMQIYQHFEDPLEAKRLFIRMGQDDYRMWEPLMGWVDADYRGTWHDWWEKVKQNTESGPSR